MKNYKNGIATFIMPHWRIPNELSRIHLDEAVYSIVQQTDSNWQLVLIDDCSPCLEAIQYLDQIKKRLKDKVTIIKLKQNCGPGIARNKGIEWAYQNDSPIILFLDADDVCHPKRLESVRRHFMNTPEVNVVYSSFKVIDEYGDKTAYDSIPLEIREILNGHKEQVVQGENAWIQIATEKNYTNLTSSTAVKTSIAYKTPFPDVRVSEDAHTWLRYGAHKGIFIYDKYIPSLYRIPTVSKSASASRHRLKNFCLKKMEVYTDGFLKAMEIAIANGTIKAEEKEELLIRFYIKLAEDMKYAGAKDLKSELMRKATMLNLKLSMKSLGKKGII